MTTYLPNGNIIWNDQTITELTKNWESGIPIRHIALKMGITVGSVMGKIVRLGLPLRKERAAPRMKPTRGDFPELRHNTCAYPMGDPKDEDFRFCGQEIARKSYCSEHIAIAYSPVKKRTPGIPSSQNMIFSNLLGRLVPSVKIPNNLD